MCLLVGLATAAFLTAQVPAPRQERPISDVVPVTSATIRVERRPAPGRDARVRTPDLSMAVYVVIENRRDVAIEALGYELYDSPASAGPRRGFSTDAQGSGVPVIGPRAIREYQLDDLAVTPIAKLQFVFYTDLVFEGSANARGEILRDRERLADEYAYWIAVLEEARAKPSSGLRAFLDGKHQLRLVAQASSADRVSSSVARLALSVADVAAREPDGVSAAIDRNVAHMRARREALLRHRR